MTCVLIVEDEPSILQNLGDILSYSGYQVMLACDGEVALEMIAQREPDLILSDIMMPRVDGYELLRQLRVHDRWHDIPVVLLSAKSDPKDLRKGMNLGADDYLIKPFDIDELLQTLTTRLGLSRRCMRLEGQHQLPLLRD